MLTTDGDDQCLLLADRHYSRGKVGSRLFLGPGEKMVLRTPDGKAVFGWRKCKYRKDGQYGIECTIFRNEGDLQSSILIKEAIQWARAKWGEERIFTYVNPKYIKSTNPGYCFIVAGFKRVGTFGKNNLILLEICGDTSKTS